MRDTPREIEERVIAMMRERTPEERWRMVSGMFHTAKVLILADIHRRHHDITPREAHVELFRRMYGEDFSAEERERICRHLYEHYQEKNDDNK